MGVTPLHVDDAVTCLDGCPIDVPPGSIGTVLLLGPDGDVHIRWPDVGVQAWTVEEAETWLVVVDR